MVKELQYTNIRRVLDNIMDHPMLRDVTLEQAVRYTIRFISIHGYSKLYKDKIDYVDIHEFRGVMPCDLISIIQVKDMGTGICMRAMTDNFTPGLHERKEEPFTRKHTNLLNNVKAPRPLYIPPAHKYLEEPAFKTQGRIIYTSFPEGCIEVAYKSIPVDEDGFPLLIDNENYLAALEAYIKKQVFTVKFDTGKISAGVLQNAQKDYAWLAGQLEAEFTMPSVSEAEALSRAMTAMIPRVMQFDRGFRGLGNREYLRNH
jgi:hypothetical protein